jgi:hypothetical protein
VGIVAGNNMVIKRKAESGKRKAEKDVEYRRAGAIRVESPEDRKSA